jgi:small subunit ribosomal protein S3
MGQKTHPFGFRVGITEAHKSRWYAPKLMYGELLVEDQKIRKYIDKKLNRTPPFAAVSDVLIERTREELKVLIRSARPGLVIGPKGAGVDELTQEIQRLTGRKVVINIIEVKNPDTESVLIAESISEQIKKRASFRRVLKMRGEAALGAGAQGVKIQISGRLGGAELGRTETFRLGSIPLQTLQANVDYGVATAITTYGAIGIKVWVYKGMYEQLKAEEEAMSRAAGARPRARGRR